MRKKYKLDTGEKYYNHRNGDEIEEVIDGELLKGTLIKVFPDVVQCPLDSMVHKYIRYYLIVDVRKKKHDEI